MEIDLKKFLESWFEARRFMSDNECGYVQAALLAQGLKYDGEKKEIVEADIEKTKKILKDIHVHKMVERFRSGPILEYTKGTERNYPDELGRLVSIYRRGIEDTLKEMENGDNI